MSTMQVTHALEAGGRRSLVDLVFGALGALRREIRIRRSRLELSRMSAHMLQDLGLTRGEVEHVVRHGRS
jgi:uncharacterized protein YjiS (DUF1127 family)